MNKSEESQTHAARASVTKSAPSDQTAPHAGPKSRCATAIPLGPSSMACPCPCSCLFPSTYPCHWLCLLSPFSQRLMTDYAASRRPQVHRSLCPTSCPFPIYPSIYTHIQLYLVWRYLSSFQKAAAAAAAATSQ